MPPIRILVTEDERITALDLKMTLIDLGYEVVDTVASAEESVTRTATLKPDLVLMDIHLKTEMLGTEAAEIIEREFGIPVIFLTAYSDTSIVEQAAKSLPYGYIVKPFERKEMDAAIQVALARHQANKELRYSDQRLRMALESAEMDIWEWSPGSSADNSDIDLSHQSKIVVYSLDELLKRIHPEDLHLVNDDLASCSQIQRRVRMKNGDAYQHCELFASTFHSNSGNKRLVGVIRNVEDSYRREEKLRQANAVFESTSEAIIITDPQRRIISVNPAFTDVTGYRSDEVIGRDPDEFLHARRHTDHFYPKLMEKDKKFWSGEIGCNRKNGKRFSAWEHISAVFNDDKKIINFVFTISDIEKLRRAEKHLARMAYTDSMTGIGNRVYLEQQLSDVLRRRNVKDAEVAVMYIDLDGFKVINDTLGHGEGDTLLKVVADRLTMSVRVSDVVTRIGGDEFVILVREVESIDGLKRMAEKLLYEIHQPIQLSRELVQVSASIGIAVSNEVLEGAENLISAADTALFQAKNLNKNCYCFYDSKLAEESREKLELERQMKHALRRNEIHVYFQPLVDILRGKVYGAEALSRWHHPVLGNVSPERFIPIAEQSNLILELGYKVIEDCCRALNEFQAMGYADIVISINVSTRQLTDRNFPDVVSGLIHRYGVDPGLLELEVTETAIQNNDRARAQLDTLRSLGIKFALDDFGTGYSSLSRLKHLPFDRVKIDRGFIADLPTSESDKEICRAILALCNVLGLEVTAEGVENLGQLTILEDMGCDCVQGFYYSEARPLKAFVTWVGEYYKKLEAVRQQHGASS